MASTQTVKLNLDTAEFDRGIARATRSLGSVDRSANQLRGAFSNLQTVIVGAVAALGTFKLAKGFLDTAREMENLGVQLKFLTGSAEDGKRALDIVADAAANSTFQLQDMALAAPSLLAVTDNVEELGELLAITGDIAAASGLDFQTVALQLQRTFSAGIASADLFRDRAVKSMLGFEEGVKFTAEQSRDHIINGFRDGTFSIIGASAEMASTFDGVVSMMNDKFFKFQTQVMDAGPFEALKAAMKVADNALVANFGSIENAALKIGDAIVSSTVKVLLFATQILDSMKPVFDFIGTSIANLVNFVRALPPPIDTLGVIGFLMLGGKGKLVVAIIAGAFDTIRALIGDIIGGLGVMYGAIARAGAAVGLFSTEQLEAAEKAVKEMADTSDRLNTSMADLNEITEDVGNKAKVVFEGLGIELDADTMKAKGLTGALLEQIKAIDKLILKNREVAEASSTGGTTTTTTESDTKVDTALAKKLKKEADQLAKKFETLKQSLFTEEEAEMASYNSKLKILDEYYKGRAHFDKQYARMREVLETQHQKKLDNIAKAQTQEQLDIFKSGQFQKLDLSKLTNDQMVDLTMGAGREVLGELAKQNKAAFEAQKALNIASAIMNTAAGAAKALSQGGIFGPILAGLVVAAGAIQIATIRSQQYQGRATGGLTQAGTPYVVGERGPELFMPNQTGTIIPNGNMASGKDVNVTFNIQALDARGVDELIVERKGIITNIIRDAAEQKGERSPV